jgi:TRAP-type mannitol/chloroaromatic compound transport system permease small subunit
MKNIANLFDNINRYTGYLCAFLVVLMTVNVFIVVFLRYLFGISFIWLQETYVWMHAYIFMAGAGFTYLNDAHVRIDIIYRSSSKVYKAIVDLVGNIFLLMPFLYIIWSYSFPFVYKSFQINEVSREAGGLPMLFLLKAVILIFAFLLFIQALSKLINNFIIIYQK